MTGVQTCALPIWDQLRWSDSSISEKKDIINRSNIVFTAAETPVAWKNAKDKLIEQKVNDLLLDCSDAHYLSGSPDKDRVGNCFTWIKADTTFEGLRQIINEPYTRLYIGEEPELLRKVRSNKTRYIKTLDIKKGSESTLDEEWFGNNEKIQINHGLTAIIGNKGSGKSAIADTLGLLGNTQQSSHFSFLNPRKFRDKKDNKAKHFKATLEWESGDLSIKYLNDDVDSNTAETIKCIPQNYLEKICTEQIEGSLFTEELKKVIFSHVSAAEKLSFSNLDDLLDYKTKEKSNSIKIAQNEISTLNAEIVSLETKLHLDYKSKITNKLNSKIQEKVAHELAKPEEKQKPENNPAQQKKIEAISTEIYIKVDEIKSFEKKIEQLEKERKNDYSKYINSKKLLEKLDNFQKQYVLFKKQD